MLQSADPDGVTMLGHRIVLRWKGASPPGPDWHARWRDLLAPWCNLTVPSPVACVFARGCDALPAVETAPVTFLVVGPHPQAPDAFVIIADPPPGAAPSEVRPAWNQDTLLRELERLAFTVAVARSPFSLIAHAGAVSRNGAALVLPALSGAGKTTLAYGLGARGWLPLCDDVCPFEEADGALVALGCPRCGHLNLRSEGVLRQAGIGLEGPVAGLNEYFRPTRWGQPAPVRAIVVPRFEAGVALTVETLTMAEGAAALYSATFPRERVSHRDEWAACVRLGAQAPAFRLTYGSLDSALAGIDTITQAIHIG